jgi:5-methyltetrahydrofolate--homocysteine methyltransferase
MTFFERLLNDKILFDGAMGTQIHALDPSDEDYEGKIGCSEILNLTLSDKIQDIHNAYLLAGADVIETNTFGANKIVLAEYDLQNKVQEINITAAQIARRAAEQFSDKPRFVAGSMGPGTKLAILGQTDFDALYDSYHEQAIGLLKGGVDLFIIETCQDPVQIKACTLAVQDAMRENEKRLPLAVSVTVETTGTLLVGSTIEAVLTILAPFEIDILGMNCATGPDHMRPYLKQICEQFDGPVICQPNAGLPQNVNGEMVYTLSVEQFSDTLLGFTDELGVQIIGGCCGTTPEYIRALASRLAQTKLKARTPRQAPSVASLFSVQSMRQDPPPFYVGERANTNGSKQFRKALLAEDWDTIVDIARQQQRTGAHGLDICVAYTGRNEVRDMDLAVSKIITQIDLPLFIDSTDPHVIEEALKKIGGRATINSINLEDGEERAHHICALAKRYGAALIALTIDEKGMAHDVEQKLNIAKRIYNIAVNEQGLSPHDLIYDTLTFTLGSGDESLKTSGMNTLLGIRRVKEELPGVFSILGVSNISFGLSPHSREILNSVFLAEALAAGLDFAIVNVQKTLPLYQIDQNDVDQCLDLIYNRGSENPLFTFIEHFDKKAGVSKAKPSEDETAPLEDRIKERIVQGNRVGLEKLLMQALDQYSAIQIINKLLIPAMKRVGDLFGAGKMQLPFVLQSAEVMKFAVDKLEPFMKKTDTQSQLKIVLATVRGDVHDIGKNLVDIILSNNGFKIYNLGIKCEIDTMLQEAERVGAHAIGMSGLLVKSTVIMKENIEEMQKRGMHIPVLLGGAALTRSYVDDICAPLLEAPVVYCADAFAGLNVMSLIQNNDLESYVNAEREKRRQRTQPKPRVAPQAKEETIRRDVNIPYPPFWGDKIVTDIDLNTVFEYLTETVLFRGRWGYRRGTLSREEYENLLETTVRPEFESLKSYAREHHLLDPKLVYGYYQANSDGNDVIVYRPNSDQEWIRFTFPRQNRVPNRSIADFFLPLDSGKKDIIALQVVTVGMEAQKKSEQLYENNEYKNYLMFHGLAVETAEALAEYWHEKIRKELNITEQDGVSMEEFLVQTYRGSRYSFGYPACPDLSENRKIFQLLRPERIDVTLSEEDQMVPEQTTSAFIVHHPQAKYFALD